MDNMDPPERELLKPVLRLFPKGIYRRFVEVPLGRKRIDVLCVPKQQLLPHVSVELKVKEWRRALWQAIVNLQMAQESYVAIWHRYEDRVLKHRQLMDQYGVGLIVVDGLAARTIFRSNGRPKRIRRDQKKSFYKTLVSV
jgi:hypothetical protein